MLGTVRSAQASVLKNAIIVVLMLLVTVVGSLNINGSLMIYSLATLAALVLMGRRLLDASVMPFILIFQWLQVSLSLFTASLRGETLAAFYPLAPLNQAIMTGCNALIMVGLGMSVAWKGVSSNHRAQLRAELQNISFTRLIQLHVFLFAVSWFATRFLMIGGLAQPIIAFAQLRFATLFVICAVSISRGKHQLWFILLLTLEILNSLGDYFASFRTPLFITFLAVVALSRNFNARQLTALTLLAAVTLYFAVVWSAIKTEYRDLANTSGAQVVTLNRTERLSSIVRLWSELNDDIFRTGVENLAYRLSYVEYLAHTMQYVPKKRQHEDGGLMLAAFAHIAIPRLVWADKPPLMPDTQFTRKYTGLTLYTAGKNTSISIGWVGDLYIDFGKYLLLLPAFAFGWLLMKLFQLIVWSRRSPVLINLGMATCAMLVFSDFGISAIKLLGGLVTMVIVAVALQLTVGRSLYRWLLPYRAGTTATSV